MSFALANVEPARFARGLHVGYWENLSSCKVGGGLIAITQLILINLGVGANDTFSKAIFKNFPS